MCYSEISGDRLLSDALRVLVSRKVNHQILKGTMIKTRAAMIERLRLLFEPHSYNKMKIAQYADWIKRLQRLNHQTPNRHHGEAVLAG